MPRGLRGGVLAYWSAARAPRGRGSAGLDRPGRLDIVLKGGMIGVCTDGRRTPARRFPELRGDSLSCFGHTAGVAFDAVEVSPLL